MYSVLFLFWLKTLFWVHLSGRAASIKRLISYSASQSKSLSFTTAVFTMFCNQLKPWLFRAKGTEYKFSNINFVSNPLSRLKSIFKETKCGHRWSWWSIKRKWTMNNWWKGAHHLTQLCQPARGLVVVFHQVWVSSTLVDTALQMILISIRLSSEVTHLCLIYS